MQDSIEFTTPGGHTVVIKGFVTGKIRRAIQGVMFGGLTMSADSSQTPQFSGDAMLKANDTALSLMVTAIDGNSLTPETALDAVEALPEADYDAIKAEVDKVTTPLATKNAGTSTTATTTDSSTGSTSEID